MGLTSAILVVEREPTIAALIIELLSDEGYHAHAASTGREGLAAIAFDSPALTRFDMALPDLSAQELIAQLRVKRGTWRASGMGAVAVVQYGHIPARAVAPMPFHPFRACHAPGSDRLRSARRPGASHGRPTRIAAAAAPG